MKTVLLLGAGIPRAARPNISIKSRAPLDADFFNIARVNNSLLTNRVLNCLYSLVGDYADTLSGSLETATTYLYLKSLDSKSGSPYHTAFLQLLDLLNLVLANTTNPIRTGPRSLLYRFILSELAHVKSPEDLSIITFNYDLILERVLESIDSNGHEGYFLFPGCYRLEGVTRIPAVTGSPQFITEDYDHKGIAILKLHGSMNWQSSHISKNPTPSALLSTSRALNVVDSPMIPRSLTRRVKRKSYMKPIIIPPVSGKRGILHKRIVPLWTEAGAVLREADRVVISGYSCPPLDLEARILLSENLKENTSKKVYVIDPNPATAATFLELCGVDHITSYTSIESWVDDATE